MFGTIAWLPAEDQIPLPIRTGLGLGSGAFNHPCIIMGVHASEDLVFCLPVTSFGGTTIQDKYTACHDAQTKTRIFDRYIALKNHKTVAHNDLGILDHDGLRMEKQSYVHLDGGYWIDSKWLTPSGRKLYSSSFLIVRRLYYATDSRCLTAADKLGQSNWRQSPISCPERSPMSARAVHVAPSSSTAPWRTSTVARAASNAAIPSPAKQQAMNGSWRRTAKA